MELFDDIHVTDFADGRFACNNLVSATDSRIKRKDVLTKKDELELRETRTTRTTGCRHPLSHYDAVRWCGSDEVPRLR